MNSSTCIVHVLSDDCRRTTVEMTTDDSHPTTEAGTADTHVGWILGITVGVILGTLLIIAAICMYYNNLIICKVIMPV